MPPIWTAPRTWVSGEVVTAALMNTHVRDNLEALDARISTTYPTVVATSFGAANAITGTTFTQVLGLSHTYSFPANHRLLLWFSSGWQRPTTAGEIRFTFNVSGSNLGDAAYGIFFGSAASSAHINPMTAFYLLNRSAVTNSVLQPRAATDSGTLNVGFGLVTFGFSVFPNGQ